MKIIRKKIGDMENKFRRYNLEILEFSDWGKGIDGREIVIM